MCILKVFNCHVSLKLRNTFYWQTVSPGKAQTRCLVRGFCKTLRHSLSKIVSQGRPRQRDTKLHSLSDRVPPGCKIPNFTNSQRGRHKTARATGLFRGQRDSSAPRWVECLFFNRNLALTPDCLIPDASVWFGVITNVRCLTPF